MGNPLSADGIDILYRGRTYNAVELRSDSDEGGSTLHGYFTRFDDWYEIDSWLEGNFMERTQKGAFAKTISENRSNVVCSFDHGYDWHLGDKPLGPITELREEDEGVYYEVPLLDTDYNRDFVLPALQGRTIDGRNLGSVLGASFRMRVIKDEWDLEPNKSAHNPQGIPERTITEVRLYEFGPVVYPASPTATASVRCLTDHYFERSLQKQNRRNDLANGAGTSTPSGTETSEPREHSQEPPATRSATSIRLAMALANSPKGK